MAEEAGQEVRAILGAQLTDDESRGDANFGIGVGEGRAAAAQTILIQTDDPHNDRQRLHEGGTDGGRRRRKDVAHFIGKIPERLAAAGKGEQGFAPDKIGAVAQSVGNDDDIGLECVRPDGGKAGDGGRADDGIGVFGLFEDERELRQCGGAGFAENAEGGGPDLRSTGSDLVHEGRNGGADGGLVLPGKLDDGGLDFGRLARKLGNQSGVGGRALFVGNGAGGFQLDDHFQSEGPRGDAHLGVTGTDERKNRVEIGERETADGFERVQRGGFEFRASGSGENVEQRLAMSGCGFSGLTETFRSGRTNVPARVVEQRTNGVKIVRGRPRIENHGENRDANVRIRIGGVLEHLGGLRPGLRAEPAEELQRLEANGLRGIAAQQLDDLRGSAGLAPVAQGAHGEDHDFLGGIGECGDRALDHRCGWLIRAVFERIDLPQGRKGKYVRTDEDRRDMKDESWVNA